MNSIQTPVLTLLRRLEAQNIWRMTYNVGGAVGQSQTASFSTAAMPLTEETTSLNNTREWYEDSSLTAQDALGNSIGIHCELHLFNLGANQRIMNGNEMK